MSATQVVVRGTLRSDGLVELEENPGLPSGPVEVLLRPSSPSSPQQEDWWQYLQRVRAEAEAAGGPFRTWEEIEKERADFRRERDDDVNGEEKRGHSNYNEFDE